jgi:predicted nucleic acid-binding protein
VSSSDIVFDSWAILALIQDEPAAPAVEALLLECVHDERQHFITVVTFGEIWYTLARKTSSTIADQKLQEIVDTGIELVDANWTLTRSAADFKSRFRMSFADAYAAALTKDLGAELVTGDLEFKPADTEIRIHWLPRQRANAD